MIESEKVTKAKFNFLKKYYDETWDDAEHTLHVGVFKSERDSLAKAYAQATQYLVQRMTRTLAITQTSVILDIGCGTGRTLIDLCMQFGCSGVGIDLSDEQIRDAQQYARAVNAQRIQKGLSRIKVKYLCASGSDLNTVFKKDEQFTHVISQDALFLVADRESLFRNIQRLLVPGGVFAAVDFLSESTEENRTTEEQELVYRLVNWNENISFASYKNILQSVGLDSVQSELRNKDMILTYSKLAKKMEKYIQKGDATYAELRDRYLSIVSSVKQGKMAWGFFCAQKQKRKTVLLAGTKAKSIGRFLGEYLYSKGWDVWLYSRSAQKVEKPYWHERACDISKEKHVRTLLKEIHDLDLVVMLADADGHGSLEELSGEHIANTIKAKLTGSVILNAAVLKRYVQRKNPIQIVWCAGKPTKKAKNLILYSLVNSGLAAYVNELNDHYRDVCAAYYVPMGVVSPSTLGDEFIRKNGSAFKQIAVHPRVIAETVQKIIDKKVEPGMVNEIQNLL